MIEKKRPLPSVIDLLDKLHRRNSEIAEAV